MNDDPKKIAIVTGGNIGIGYETVKGLLQDKRIGSVIIATRSLERGQQAIDQLKSELSPLHFPSAAAASSAPSSFQATSYLPRVSCMSLDLEDLDSVDHFAQQFLALRCPLHLLICNAGLLPLSGQLFLSPQGHERTLAVNHLGHFLLVLHLLPALLPVPPRQPHPRVVFLSSMVHQYAKPAHLLSPLPPSPSAQLLYARSKLANVLCCYELHRRFSHLGLTANAVHPGVVATDILKEAPLFVRLLGPLFMRLVGRSPATGALGSLYLALSPEMEGRGGCYIDQEDLHLSSPDSYDAEAAKALWEASLVLVEAHKRVTFPFQSLECLQTPYPKPPPIKKKFKIPWKLIIFFIILIAILYQLYASFSFFE